MTIITKGMGAILKAVKKRKTLTISGSPKKVYKSIQKKFHGLTPNQKSEIYMKKAKRDPKSFHYDKKKFGKK